MNRLDRKSIFGAAGLIIALTTGGCSTRNFSFSQTPHHKQATLVDVQASVTSTGKNGKCTILFMVDNSGSMADNQAAVASEIAQLGSFFREFPNLTFVIITTEAYLGQWGSTDGLIPPSRIIRTSDPNAAQLFSTEVAALGTSGSGSERVFESFAAYLPHEGYNSQTHTIVPTGRENFEIGSCGMAAFITDELEQGSITGAQLKAQFDEFLSLKNTGQTTSWLTAAVIDPSVDQGSRFRNFVDLVANGSFLNDIRTSGWATGFLDNLTRSIQTQIGRSATYSIEFPGPVDEKRVTVRINDYPLGSYTIVPVQFITISPDRRFAFLDKGYVDGIVAELGRLGVTHSITFSAFYFLTATTL